MGVSTHDGNGPAEPDSANGSWSPSPIFRLKAAARVLVGKDQALGRRAAETARDVAAAAPRSVEHGLHRAEAVVERLELVGATNHYVEWLGRGLKWWRRLGLRRAIAVMLMTSLPTLKYAVLPELASSASATLAEGYGVELEVGDWDADLVDLKLIGENISVAVDGPFAKRELLDADAVEVDLSLWRWLRYGKAVHAVTVIEPVVYLERQVGGRWNWEDLLKGDLFRERDPQVVRASLEAGGGSEVAAKLARLRDGLGEYDIVSITAKDMTLQWVENVPGGSGGGMVVDTKASLTLSKMTIAVSDLVVPVDDRSSPTEFSIQAETGDGRVFVNGSGNFFRWVDAGRPADGSVGIVKARSTAPAWVPTFETTITLDNVGVRALGRLVPMFGLVMSAGTADGEVKLALTDTAIICHAAITLNNVSYVPGAGDAANAQLQRDLERFRANGQTAVNCSGQRNDPGYRPVQVLQAGLTREVVKQAPPSIQRAALFDDQSAMGRVGNELVKGAGIVAAAKLGEAIGGRVGGAVAGAAMASAFAAPQTTSAPAGPTTSSRKTQKPEGNAVGRGLQKVGRGFKGLFGGGKKKEPQRATTTTQRKPR